jgi:hypothetical protein
MYLGINSAALLVGLLLTTGPSAADRSRIERPPASVRIVNVRLESVNHETPKPTAVLKFDLLNDTSVGVSDVVIEISIVEKSGGKTGAQPPRIVVAPFTIRSQTTIEAGYTVNYAMLLRNLSSDCDCIANVSVLSALPLLPSSR